MTYEDACRVQEALTAAGYRSGVYRGYSGRYMFGKTTEAVTMDLHPKHFAEEFPKFQRELCPRSDNYGHGWIIY